MNPLAQNIRCTARASWTHWQDSRVCSTFLLDTHHLFLLPLITSISWFQMVDPSNEHLFNKQSTNLSFFLWLIYKISSEWRWNDRGEETWLPHQRRWACQERSVFDVSSLNPRIELLSRLIPLWFQVFDVPHIQDIIWDSISTCI
jgi:hypothetical protein